MSMMHHGRLVRQEIQRNEPGGALTTTSSTCGIITASTIGIASYTCVCRGRKEIENIRHFGK